MISLLVIGFGMLGIGIRLMTLRNNLRRVENVRVEIANRVLREGWLICIVGLISLLVGIWGPLLNSEAMILIRTGESIMYVGLLSLIQGVVQRGRGTEHHVCIGAWTVTWIGLALIVAYAIYRIIMILI